jgi:hypothetical protein
MEKEIMNIKTRCKIDHADARRKYFQSNPLGKRTYASTVVDNMLNQPPGKTKKLTNPDQTRINENGGSGKPPLGKPPGKPGSSIKPTGRKKTNPEVKNQKKKPPNQIEEVMEIFSEKSDSE